MKKSLSIITAAFCVAFGFISAFAQAAKPAPAGGLLYKISGKNLQKPSYLYGTFHLLCQEDMFGMDKLNSYIDQTDRILMELDMDNPA